jgi:hypothetical protein
MFLCIQGAEASEYSKMPSWCRRTSVPNSAAQGKMQIALAVAPRLSGGSLQQHCRSSLTRSLLLVLTGIATASKASCAASSSLLSLYGHVLRQRVQSPGVSRIVRQQLTSPCLQMFRARCPFSHKSRCWFLENICWAIVKSTPSSVHVVPLLTDEEIPCSPTQRYCDLYSSLQYTVYTQVSILLVLTRL